MQHTVPKAIIQMTRRRNYNKIYLQKSIRWQNDTQASEQEPVSAKDDGDGTVDNSYVQHTDTTTRTLQSAIEHDQPAEEVAHTISSDTFDHLDDSTGSTYDLTVSSVDESQPEIVRVKQERHNSHVDVLQPTSEPKNTAWIEMYSAKDLSELLVLDAKLVATDESSIPHVPQLNRLEQEVREFPFIDFLDKRTFVYVCLPGRAKNFVVFSQATPELAFTVWQQEQAGPECNVMRLFVNEQDGSLPKNAF
jgi:hypothetical protein